MCVPTVGNPMTVKITIDAPRKSNAGPVAKKSAPISWQLTPEVSKLPNVANNVIGTSKSPYASRAEKEEEETSRGSSC